LLLLDPSIEASAVRPEPLIYRLKPRNERLRKICDAAVAVSALLIASPLLLIAAAAIRLEDRGPVFFRQERVGRFGRPFVIYKLRTMKVRDLDDKPAPKNASDARITRVGRVLRKTSIDELPQLINIAKGEMAIVGPRPEMPFVVRSYQSWQHLRLLVMPGLTGLWQVKARKTIPLHLPEATLIDIDYIRKSTTLLNVSIIAQTVKTVVCGRGAF
jgi:lipopolysaccharide/colanic/teichoic acid biosynthesis glycosyltransferase